MIDREVSSGDHHRRGRNPLLVVGLILGGACGCGMAALIAFILLGIALSQVPDKDAFQTRFLNQTAPPLTTTGTWLNTQGPHVLSDFQGKVVWLEFSFRH